MSRTHFSRLILLFVLLSAFLYRCDTGESAAVSSTEAVEIPVGLQSFTSGVIGRNEALFVQFSEAPTVAADQLIKTSPATAGDATLMGNTLSYKPTNGWQAGTNYTVTVNVPGGGNYTFPFSTLARKAEVVADGVYIPSGGGSSLAVTGRVLTNDASSVEEISSLLAASQGGNKLDVVVEALPGNQVFSYTISGPNRGKSPAPVIIAYDGKSLGFADVVGKLNVAIPADDDFRLEKASVEDDGSILLRFTDVLKAKQNFKGQIQFANPQGEGGLPASFTTKVDGNLLYVYPKGNDLGNVRLALNDGVQNTAGSRLGLPTNWDLNLGRTEPGLRAVGKGAILPHQGQRLFPFEAVGVSSIQFELVQIYENNVNQFLQDGDLGDASDDWSLNRVGKIVAQERIELSSLSAAVNTSRWSRYALDLGKYITGKTSAIYQVRLGFTMDDAVTSCGVTASDFGLPAFDDKSEDDFQVGFREVRSAMGDYYGIHGEYADYNWRDRDNPCTPAYFNRERFVTQNVVSSNLGLIAKQNPDRKTVVFATDLIKAGPRSGVTIMAYDRQHQLLFTGKTDGQGRVEMETEFAPAVITAASGEDVAYLDIHDNPGLPLGRFAVGGAAGSAGIKGAFYTERGVWRPGDSVFLNFVLEDRMQRLPEGYPVEFVLRDPMSRVVERRTVKPAFTSGLYALTFQTKKEDITGGWMAEVKAGGRSFNCPLTVETVKPNRLSIDLDLPAGGLTASRNQVQLISKWLYGAPASSLKARVELSVFPRSANFDGWGDFVFQDPARELYDNDLGEAFDGTLDEDGKTSLVIATGGNELPGPVSLGVATKVFEPGGNFSIDNQFIPFDPYPVYAGVNIPEDDWGSRRVALEGGSNVRVATVNPGGKAVGNRDLTVGLYRVSWRYWWQDNYDNVARFSGSRHTEALQTYKARTTSDGTATVKVEVSEWGRYLLRVCDSGGHCSGEYFYAGYNKSGTDRESASLLRPQAERESVATGDEVKVTVPTSAGGSLLVSLETGAGTLMQFWVDAKAGETEITFKADERMVPTVYANITLLQPYEQTTNDRPVRLYGVVPIEVKDPETVLAPVVDASDEWSPEETVTVSVNEENGKPMTYTLAVVDEGLLGLTRFSTPDLHDKFFAKEALSVKTFDLYRYVVGSLNGEFGKVLAIGGDGSEEGEDSQTANRFEPVVRHLGPFRLAGGKSGKHEISLPNYVGAVRVMVVASDSRAYGSADKRIPVRQPLMLLPTLPRVLGPGERVDMPVNVFAMSNKVKNVTIGVTESEGLVTVPAAKQSVAFSEAGNQLAYFPLEVGNRTGIARFSVSGSGNGETASQEVEIDVRHPNRSVSRSMSVAIAPGESAPMTYTNFGVPGTQGAMLELSNLPAMQLDRHLKYLLRYPYGCVEQTVSPAFAQLYLDKVTELSADQDKLRRANVTAGLNALRKFQTSSGGMAYWPGGRDAHPWASNYALHFLIEAERAGYGVPQDLKKKLVKFQAKVSKDWKENNRVFYVSTSQRRLDQAYRLYGLALAGNAEIGAMNRLKGKSGELTTTARFQLAGAYALAGQKKAAEELTNGTSTTVSAYRELGYTFGSDIRDMALILESQLAAGDEAAASQQVFQLAKRIGDRSWLSTQEAAFAFVAIGKLSQGADSALSADFTSASGAKNAVGSSTGIYQIELPTDGAQPSISLRNTGKATLYATIVTSGKPLAGEEIATSKNLRLDVTYTDSDGAPVDVNSLPSGTEFTATYTVTNPGTLGTSYRQLALRSLLPSGWEVSNDRLNAGGGAGGSSFDYQDFRDDGVYTFFNLGKGQSKSFAFRMTATYPGRYYLPSQLSEAMYSDEVQAAVKGRWMEVSK
jgi:uncharacterized protein YfaS (alpha-2-macroglobulin family)